MLDMTHHLAARATTWAATVRTDLDIDFDDGSVNPPVKAAVDNTVATVLYACAALLFMLAVFGVLQKAGGNKAGMSKIIWGLIGCVVCLAPTQVGSWALNGISSLMGVS